MTNIFNIICVLIISIELFFMAFYGGYFTQKVKSSTILKAILIWVLSYSIMLIGDRVGVQLKGMFEHEASWYSSTILFAIALKYILTLFSLKKARNTINPLSKQGLVIVFGLSVNALFLGLANGLFSGNNLQLISVLPTIIIPIVALFYGSKQTKFISFKYEVWIAAILVFYAVTILKK